MGKKKREHVLFDKLAHNRPRISGLNKLRKKKTVNKEK